MPLYASTMTSDRSACIVRRDGVILDDVISFFHLETWRGCFIVPSPHDCHPTSSSKSCLWLLSPLYRYYLLKVCKITEWHFLVISTEFLKVWTTRKKNCLKKNIIAEQHQIPWQTNLWQGEKLEKLFKSPRCLSLQLNYFVLSSWGRNLHLIVLFLWTGVFLMTACQNWPIIEYWMLSRLSPWNVHGTQ